MANTNKKKHNTLRFLFWNARSLKKRIQELPTLLLNLDVFICVESWLSADKDSEKRINFPGFLTLRQDRLHSRGGGIVIMIRKNIAYFEIKDIKSPDLSVELYGIKITNTNPSLDIIVCYRSPGSTLSQAQWDMIVNNTNNRNNCILVGDFNSHNQAWNCVNNDINGVRFLNSIDNHNLLVHNVDTNTYINLHSDRKSNLDLIISSQNIYEKINVTVLDGLYGSDHFPVFFEIQVEKHVYIKKTFKLKTVSTDWKKFTTELDNKYEEFLSNEYNNLSSSDKYDFFTCIVTNSIINSNPKPRPLHSKKNIKNPAPWWNEICNEMKKMRKGAYKKWEDSKCLTDLIEFKKIQALATKTFKVEKKKYFKRFAETIDFRIDRNYVWKKCKILKNKWIKINPTHTPENLQKSDKIVNALEKISPPWVKTDPSSLPECRHNEFFDTPFDYYEFNTALIPTNNKSSPGMDGIDFEIIKNLPIKYHLLLLDIYNEMFLNNDYPITWKKSYIHFIDKPEGKGVRPIALTSCFSKLFESLIKNRLMWWCEYNNILPESQSGFRKGKSCIDNLTNLALNINETLMKNKSLLAAFLDVRGAFDNVNIDILLEKLANIGCSENILLFVKFLTQERNIYTDEIGDSYRTVNKGAPQGGVLSPLLYIIYVKDILVHLPKSIKISQFADDIAVYSNLPTVQKCRNAVEKAVNIIKDNLNNIGLDLAPEKTVLIHFNKQRIKPGETSITVNDCTINSSETVRFLGIILDYKFSFIPHINNIHKKCTRAINLIKFLCGTWWGSDPQTLLTLYKSYVRPILEYGIFIYFPTQKYLVEKIEKLQYTALRAALGYRTSTPTNVILAESKFPLIEERAKLSGKRFVTKAISNNKSLTQETIRKYNTLLKRKKYRKRKPKLIDLCIQQTLDRTDFYGKSYDIYSYDYKTIATSVAVNTDLGKILISTNSPNEFLDKLVTDERAYAVYTDGSKSQDSKSTGTACLCPDLNLSITCSIDKVASVYTAECIALSNAMDIALDNPSNNHIIFSDSLSALHSLQATRLKTTINPHILEIKRKYNEFLLTNPNHSIKFIWIPSHSGINGNEKADSLAKSASAKEKNVTVILPYTDYYEEYEKMSQKNTEEIIEKKGLTKGAKYFKNFYCKTKKSWFHNVNLNRAQIVTINRSRADHYNLSASLARINIIDSAKCQCGNETQDLNHILWQCELYDTERLKLIKKLEKLRLYLPLNVDNIIAKPNIEACKCISVFFDKCNLSI